MQTEKNKILKFNQYMNSDKTYFIIQGDLESLTKKTDGSQNSSSTTKTDEHIPCGHSSSTNLGFDQIETKHTLYRGKDCMKKFCDSLKEHAKKKIDFEIKIFFYR